MFRLLYEMLEVVYVMQTLASYRLNAAVKSVFFGEFVAISLS